jgi:hypothetical protein
VHKHGRKLPAVQTSRNVDEPRINTQTATKNGTNGEKFSGMAGEGIGSAFGCQPIHAGVHFLFLIQLLKFTHSLYDRLNKTQTMSSITSVSISTQKKTCLLFLVKLGLQILKRCREKKSINVRLHIKARRY